MIGLGWQVCAVNYCSEPREIATKFGTLTHVSFQSAGGTNKSSVNALLEVELYVRERNKGRGHLKRWWAIEMNNACELYLKNYSAVDKIDQALIGWDSSYWLWSW